MTMYINCETNKYINKAEYYYDTYTDMYRILDTPIAIQTLAELEEMFESPDLLTEVPMPDEVIEYYESLED